MTKKELKARMAPAKTLPPEVVKEKADALATVGPLQARFNALKVKDEASCQEMDAFVGDVVQARKGWGSIWARIHEKSIKPIMEGINALHEVNRVIDKPLELLEDAGKKAIKDYRIADQRRIEAARVESDKLSRQAEELQERIDNARTLVQRGKLLEKKEVIDTQAVEAFRAAAPIQTESTGHRTIPAWRLIGSDGADDMSREVAETALKCLLEGIIEGAVPISAVMLNMRYINDTFKSEPKIVATWPGLEVYDDIQIVRR